MRPTPRDSHADNRLRVVSDDESLRLHGESPSPAPAKPHGDLLPGVSAARLKRYDECITTNESGLRLPSRGWKHAGFGTSDAREGRNPTRSFGARAIFGDDDRTCVPDTEIAPYCWICDLDLVSPNDTPLFGTGWLAGPRLVITAGHCVFSHNALYGEGWMQRGRIRVMAGHKGAFAVAEAGVKRLLTTKDWEENASEELDIGAILLDKPLGDELGFFSFGNYDDDELQSLIVNIAGYPVDKGGDVMWQHANRIAQVLPQRLGYTIDTVGGDSGAPLIHVDGEQFIVVGIHNYAESIANYATRINTPVFEQIREWKGM